MQSRKWESRPGRRGLAVFTTGSKVQEDKLRGITKRRRPFKLANFGLRASERDVLATNKNQFLRHRQIGRTNFPYPINHLRTYASGVLQTSQWFTTLGTTAATGALVQNE